MSNIIPLVALRHIAGRKRLFVNGRPFVSLGIQIDFRHTDRIEDFDCYFDHIARLNCNTVYFPVRWFVFEPEQGRYNFATIDHALKRCAEKNLRMSLLWFGSNQGGGFQPAPAWIKENPGTYKRVVDEKGAQQNKLCPRCGETLAAEKRALDTLLAHLAEIDTDRRVIFLQVENEPCLEMNSKKNAPQHTLMDPWSFRCHCEACNAAFAQEQNDEWIFAARTLTQYFNRLLADRKTIYPVLTYVNFLLNPQRPGEDLDTYLAECPELDIVAVDYYGFCAADLSFTMRFFDRGRNALFVAEHSTESCGDAAGNVFRAVCEHGAIAFDPWAIDCAFGWRAWRDHVAERPFVDRADGSWSDAAVAYGRSLKALGAMNELVALNSRTEHLMYYASENGLPRSIEERRWGMVWRTMVGPAGRWVCAMSGEGDLTFAGVGLQVALEPLDTSRKWTIESGCWQEGVWVRTGDAPVKSRTESALLLDLEDGGCVRIRFSEAVPGIDT